jgi:two-component system sensor histidine kinase QseC
MTQLCVLLPLGWASYQRELYDIDKLLDAQLAQAARTLGALIGRVQPPKEGHMVERLLPDDAEPRELVVRVHRRTYETDVGFQVYDPAGRLLIASANLVQLPPPTTSERGFSTQRVGNEKWRLVTLQNRASLVIRMGERYSSRHDIIRSVILEHSLLLLIGLPILTFLTSFVVTRGLYPLNQLAQNLARRTVGSRQPVAIDNTPSEIEPLIITLNQQLEGLEDAIEREQRFASDVAHELRTPLAATMIHLESAQLTSDYRETTFILEQAQRSLGRLAQRVEQILALARVEAGAASQQRERVDLVAIVTDVIDELAPAIAHENTVLSIAHNVANLWVSGYEVALSAMFRNLIENALQHAGYGGHVEIVLHCESNRILVEIADDGPGIPPGRRDAVFTRFHRGPESESYGYGLGLNIVQRAIELHGATIKLLEPPSGRGLLVRIRMSTD